MPRSGRLHSLGFTTLRLRTPLGGISFPFVRTVYHAEGIVDAHLVKDALENAGIPAFVNGEYLIGGMGQLPARDFMTVSVPDIYADDAGPVVHEITEMLRAPIDEHAESPVPPLHLKPAAT